MKTLIIILVLAAFLQTTIIPIDLVLIILICRSYIKISKTNLYLALIFGLFVSLLRLNSLGFDSLVYLLAVQATQILSKTRLAGNSILIILVTFGLVTFSHILNSLFLHTSLDLYPKVLIESLLSFPTLYFLRIWEERFIAPGGIKLKV